MPDQVFNVEPPDEQIYSRIGKVAAEWSWVEWLLGEFLSHLCEANPGAMYVITKNVASATVTDWLKTLIKIKFTDGPDRRALIQVMNDIDTTRGERNIVVHGTWRGHAEPGFAWVDTIRWNRSEVKKSELWSLDDLNDLIIEIQQHTLVLGKLGLKLGFLKTKHVPG